MPRSSESRIIDILRKNAGMRAGTREDVEVFRRGSELIVAAVDTMVQSTDIPPGMRMADVSRKAVSACISDFAAKGTRPEFGIVSVTVPGGLPKGRIIGLARGFKRASAEFGVEILGGDLNEGVELSISVSLYGTTDRIVPRGGACTGDAIFVTGYFGNAAAGLRLLSGGRGSGNSKFDARCKGAFCNPRPRLDFGTRAKKYLSSAMDSSDGLAMTLNEMSRQSRKRFAVTKLPFEGVLEVFAKRNGTSAGELAMFGGEEYETVFTARESNVPMVRQVARNCGTDIIEIGVVRSGTGVFDQSTGKRIPDRGWSHFDG